MFRRVRPEFDGLYRAMNASSALVSASLPSALANVANIDHAILDSSSGSVRRVWAPFGRCTGGCLLHHLVNLLERETLCLWDEEVGPHEGGCAETAPDEEDGRLQVSLVLVDHVRGDNGNDGVPQPVGGSGQTNTTGSDGKWEDFTDENPCTWTPCRGKEEDEDGNESDLSIDSRDVVCNRFTSSVEVSMVEANRDANDGHQELTDQHAESAVDENSATSELLNSVEGDGCRANVDQVEDEGDQEGVVDSTRGLQEWGRVVEDEVHTSPLLHHL